MALYQGSVGVGIINYFSIQLFVLNKGNKKQERKKNCHATENLIT